MREIKELCILACFRPGPFQIAGNPVTAAPVTLLYQEVIKRQKKFPTPPGRSPRELSACSTTFEALALGKVTCSQKLHVFPHSS
jgi:hypothetical protein